MKTILMIILLSVTATFVHAQNKWTIDKGHSSVRFEVGHMFISTVAGSFKRFSGSIVDKNGSFEGGTINTEIEVGSVSTDNDSRDSHLKSSDFFDASQFPVIIFESTSIQKLDNKNYRIEGNLTMRGVKKPITLEAALGGITTVGGTTKAGFKARSTINRMDFGVSGGGSMVGDSIEIEINIELTKT